MQLEAEQTKLTAKIATERANIVTVSKEDLIVALSMYRDGDINSTKYRSKLFDTFLVAVYLYDDEFKLIFSFPGNKNSLTMPLDNDIIESVESVLQTGGVDSSSKDKSSPPNLAQTNSTPIYVISGLFVMVCPFDKPSK